MQVKQPQWLEQWKSFEDDEVFLFQDWISPNTLEDFQDKVVLEAGCGGGQHTAFIAPYAQRIVAVDLNSIEVAKKRNQRWKHITFVDDDISSMELSERFQVVICIGVVHHTDDPDATVKNLIKHTAPGGRIVLWVYSKEGNWLAEHVVEGFRKLFLRNLGTGMLIALSKAITLGLYIPVYTLYLLPLKSLPYFEYFENFRRLTFLRNTLNVFDKLNAPQVQFITRKRVESWIDPSLFHDIHISHYRGVSWRASATLASD